LYVALFGYAGEYFWFNKQPQIVGGLFTTISVCISPVITYAVQRYFNYWLTNTPGLLEEITIVFYGLASIYFIRFPFLTAPIYWALFAFSQLDLAQLIYGVNPTEANYANVSVIFGAVMLIPAFLIDRVPSTQDFAFWPYLFGVAAFWGGLSTEFFYPIYTSMAFKIFYFAVNIVMMLLSVALQRKVFLFSGAAGSIGYVVQTLYVKGTIESNSWFSVVFGAFLMGVSYYVANKNTPSNFPFWGYLFGITTYWVGWSTLFGYPVYDTEVFQFVYFFVNVLLIILWYPTQERICLVYGSLGISWFIGVLVNEYFNSYALPILLTFLGLVLIGLAVYCSGAAAKLKKYANAKKNKEIEENEIPLVDA